MKQLFEESFAAILTVIDYISRNTKYVFLSLLRRNKIKVSKTMYFSVVVLWLIIVASLFVFHYSGVLHMTIFGTSPNIVIGLFLFFCMSLVLRNTVNKWFATERKSRKTRVELKTRKERYRYVAAICVMLFLFVWSTTFLMTGTVHVFYETFR